MPSLTLGPWREKKLRGGGGIPVRMLGSDELMQLYNSERSRRLLRAKCRSGYISPSEASWSRGAPHAGSPHLHRATRTPNEGLFHPI